ncbi:zinc-dependent alcohol dehydrogenase [Pararhizobium haloflavum]|uniref:zinc-dependent alcohol dehydrogenase n=1 Tax=Pararhizobium haloflavum TaxID=2037914 RepID=UPI000C1A676B|nr:zinc-binding alcohol dehydrogenase [Pararhizobium haloflavum]
MGSSNDGAVSMTRCLTYTAPGVAEIRKVPVRLGEGDTTRDLSTLYTGISRGTERLVYQGKIPPSEYHRMRAPFQHGDFPFPVGYGYAWVGADADGRWFGLFPHQERVEASRAALIRLPEGVPARRAILAANMETALNVVWDGAIGPGDSVSIVGGGVLGLLVAGIASDIPGTSVTVIDINAQRAAVAEALGARFARPEDARDDQDIVIHTSASEAGITTALGLAGTESTVVEASWYGNECPSLPLGQSFHSKRLVLRSSQVGMVSPTRRARWTHRRRLEAALALLRSDKYDAVITGEVRFDELTRRIGEILDPQADGLATAVSYS